MTTLTAPAVPTGSEPDIFLAFPPEETGILRALTLPSASLTALIPATIDPEFLVGALGVCCRAAGIFERARRKLMPVIGRILLVLKENPDCFPKIGFDHITDFILRYVCGELGYSRSCAFEAMRLCSIFPSLTIAQWGVLGVERIRCLSKITQEGNSTYNAYLQVALNSKTHDEFERWAREQQLLDSGEYLRKPLTLIVPQTVKKHFQSFINDSRVSAVVGTTDPAVILEALMAEASSVWLVEDGSAEPYRVVQVEVEKPGLPGVPAGLAWHCIDCGMNADIHLGGSGTSLNDLREEMLFSHRHGSPNCSSTAGSFLIRGVSEI